jgi:3-oxoadipate enol-lactonase
LQVERDGARLFYAMLGNGPDVILLHPTPVYHAFWLPMAELLAEHYRFTLIDLRGHGKSTLGNGPLTMEKLAEDVHAVVAAMGITRAAFVGCSIGSYLLYEYWRQFPREVASLTLICGKPQPDTETNREKRREWMHLVQQPRGRRKFFNQMADALVGPTATRRYPEIRVAARTMMDEMRIDALLAVQQGLAQRPDSVPTLPTISIPVCAIAGGEDQSSTPAEMRVIADHVPGAEFHLLDDAGHYAPLEQPRTIANILRNFLDRHKSQILADTAGPAH